MNDDLTKTVAQCVQCGRPGIIALNDSPLCVDCYYKFEVARTLALRISAIGMNFASAEMDAVTGLKGFSPRIQVPDIPKGPIILNNIKVDNSVVGTINTGTVQAIDVSITVLKNAGSEELSKALKRLTEVIANDQSILESEKNEMLDQVSFLSEQAVAGAKERRPGLIKAAFSTLTNAATTINTLAAVWTTAEPLLKTCFGFS